MRITFPCCALVLIPSLSLSQVQAQTLGTWREAYEYAQGKRHQAWVYYDSLPRSSALVKIGITFLDTALSFLDQPKVQELANDNTYLRFRRFDVCYDLAVGYAFLGEVDRALDYLRMTAAVDPSFGSTIERMEKEEAFETLRQRPEYKQLVQRFNLYGSLFDNRALLTSYTQNLSDAEKVAGVTLFWNAVKNKFVYFDHVPTLDWNKTYLEYLSKVTDTRSTLEYYWLLQRMCALLKDGHTNVYPPAELRDSVYSRPPLRTMLVEDKVIIWKIFSDTLAQRGFRPGQEIVTIDGVPVRQYAERFVQPFMSSSTPQDLKIRTYTYSLLAGNSAKDLVIGLRDGEQTTVLRTLPRTGYGRINRTPDFDYRMLDHNIAFVALNSFERDTVLPLFEAHFEDISKADGLIIDLRLNGGGSGSVGFDILSHLTDRPFLISKSSYRASPDNLSWRAYPPGTWKSRPGKAFKKPVIVLISPMTFSAAEDFAVAFDTMKRGTLIGEPTGGSTGQPYSFKLPGGLSARVCMKRDTYPDGREFVGLGVQPHILVSPTIGDIREGRDVVLDKAINYLIAPRAK